MLPLTLVAVILVIWITYKSYKEDKIESEEFKGKFGTLTEGFNTKTKIGVFWNSLILIRWTITNLILLVLKDYASL